VNVFASLIRADKRDCFDVFVIADVVDGLVCAVNHVQNTGWHTCFFEIRNLVYLIVVLQTSRENAHQLPKPIWQASLLHLDLFHSVSIQKYYHMQLPNSITQHTSQSNNIKTTTFVFFTRGNIHNGIIAGKLKGQIPPITPNG
jgi:hypothetical protein